MRKSVPKINHIHVIYHSFFYYLFLLYDLYFIKYSVPMFHSFLCLPRCNIWCKPLNDERCHSFLDAYLSSLDSTLICLFARTYVRAEKDSCSDIIRLSPVWPSFRSFAETTRLYSSLLLARTFLSNRNKSYVFAYKRPFNITTLDLPPQTVHLRTHKRDREPSTPHVPLTFVFRATPRPKTSVPRFSLI